MSAGDSLLFVEQVDVGDGFDVAFEVAQRVDGLIDDGGRGQGDVLGGHAAGGGVSGEFEEFLDLLTLLGVHLFEDGLGALVGELGEEVGGGAGVHLFDDAGDLLGVEGFDEGLLHLGLDLFEGLGGDLFVEASEEGLALGGGEFFEDVGDVGGVHLREAVLLDLEADAAGGIAVDEVDEVPGNDAGAEAVGDAVDRFRREGL